MRNNLHTRGKYVYPTQAIKRTIYAGTNGETALKMNGIC